MHILLISGEFPPMQGGVGDYTREMARAFTAHGHEASIVIPALLAGAYREGSAELWNVLPVTRDWRWGCWGEILSTACSRNSTYSGHLPRSQATLPLPQGGPSP
jgi:hypothetical protein